MTQELEQRIAAVCVKCPHMKRQIGMWRCEQPRRVCHSKRVKQWLRELKKLEGA